MRPPKSSNNALSFSEHEEISYSSDLNPTFLFKDVQIQDILIESAGRLTEQLSTFQHVTHNRATIPPVNPLDTADSNVLKLKSVN